MTPRFPIWITLVLGVQTLLTVAILAFLVILGSAFSGEVSLGALQVAMIAAPLLVIAVCAWLSRQQWHTGRYSAAKALAFAPLAVFVALSFVLELLMA
jgi:hypothetical protein